MADSGSVELECLGLDTVASVYMNSVLVAATDNMFVR